MKLKHTKDSLAITNFTILYPGWHTYAADKRTLRAVDRACLLGVVECNTFFQFRDKREENKGMISVAKIIKDI